MRDDRPCSEGAIGVPRAVRDADVRRLTKRLIYDTVAFSEADKSGNLILRRACHKIKVQSDALKSYRCVFGYRERASKIYITFRANHSFSDLNT